MVSERKPNKLYTWVVVPFFPEQSSPICPPHLQFAGRNDSHWCLGNVSIILLAKQNTLVRGCLSRGHGAIFHRSASTLRKERLSSTKGSCKTSHCWRRACAVGMPKPSRLRKKGKALPAGMRRHQPTNKRKCGLGRKPIKREGRTAWKLPATGSDWFAARGDLGVAKLKS